MLVLAWSDPCGKDWFPKIFPKLAACDMVMLLNKIQVLAQAHFNSRFASAPKRHLRRLRWQEAFGRRERKDHSSVEWALGSCSFSSPQASKSASILLVLILYTDMLLMQLGTWCSTLVIISSDYGLSAGVCMQSLFFWTNVPFMMVLLLYQKMVPQYVHSNPAFLTKANLFASTENDCSQKSYVS